MWKFELRIYFMTDCENRASSNFHVGQWKWKLQLQPDDESYVQSPQNFRCQFVSASALESRHIVRYCYQRLKFRLWSIVILISWTEILNSHTYLQRYRKCTGIFYTLIKTSLSIPYWRLPTVERSLVNSCFYLIVEYLERPSNWK